MLKTPLTNVDAHTCFSLSFQKLNAQAILTCGITVASPNPALVIRLRKANILVDAPIYRPHTVKVQYLDKEGGNVVVREEVKEFKEFEDSRNGTGLYLEADEVARCVRDGKIESEIWGWDKMLLEMKIFDEVSVSWEMLDLKTDLTPRYVNNAT